MRQQDSARPRRPSNRRRPRTRVGLVPAGVVARMVWIAAAACRPVGVATPAIGAAARAHVVRSNVLRGDYAGSAACAACHADITAAWEKSPMHRMTRLPEQTTIRAPFDGRTFRLGNDVARLEQVGSTRFVRLETDGGRAQVYRVTKVIGGRNREDFAGVEVAAADPGAAVVGDPHAELILPVSYVFETASLRLKGYSVMVGPRPGMRAGGVWNQTCIFCHNTIPYFDDLWGTLYGPGAPRYQGEVVDRALPPSRRLRYSITDDVALSRALSDERAVLAPGATSSEADGETPHAALRSAILDARARFEPRHFVELGVGCEACHGGSREHVDDPHRLPTFEPRAPFLTVTGGDPDRAGVAAAEWQNRACARCHQVLFSRYPYTWEGGSRRQADRAGGSHITSGEARDFLLGGCASAMPCTSCHDPHGEDSRERLQQLATPAGNGVCTGCHRQLAGAEAVRAHAHHDPGAAGGACIACHMPRKNMGLGYVLTRYHRIGSPTDAARVEHDRPIECVVCHADKTVAALLDDIARLWGKHYDTAAVTRLYGSGDANALIATIDRGLPHERATGVGIARELRVRAAAPAVARATHDGSYPLVAAYARAALAAIEGRPNLPTPDDDPVAASGALSPADGTTGGAKPGSRTSRATAPPPGDDRGDDDD